MLHGSIQINGNVIGGWKINRLDPLDDDMFSEYKYEVRLNDDTFVGRVHHSYLNGAPLLLMLVFEDMWYDAAVLQADRLEGYAERIKAVQDQ